MPKLAEYEIDRVLSKDEAQDVIGLPVEKIAPNVHEAGIYRDRATGEAILVYAPLPASTTKLRKAVIETNYGTNLRSAGMKNISRVFGFTTRSVPLQREACVPTSLSLESPETQRTLGDIADALGNYLFEQLPEVYEEDVKKLEAVLPEWRMTEQALWTSGVINQSSALPYHRDRANFDSWSAMPVVRRGMEGGDLHFPEYGITVNCRDGWALWFNGFAYVHGVTPMKPRAKDGYRYSIVFYAKRGMKDCHTYAVEVGEARAKRMERESKMVNQTREDIMSNIPNGRSLGNMAIDNS
jgi:hypothetical protein